MLAHSLNLSRRISISSISNNSAEKDMINRMCQISLNQIVYITTIDVAENNFTEVDNHVKKC
jgi:hypothetical protein